MADTGIKYPGAVATSATSPYSDNDWANVGNIVTDDTTYATITADAYDTGKYSYVVKASSFGFNVPAGATINGIVVEIGSGADAGELSKDVLVQLSKDNAARVGDNRAKNENLTPAIVNRVYGGASDLWGATWTAAEINASAFAVHFAMQAVNDNSDVYLDYMRVTVYYAENSGYTMRRVLGLGLNLNLIRGVTYHT